MERWPKYSSWFWERAPFFRIAMALCLGILQYRYFPIPHNVPIGLLFVGLFFIVVGTLVPFKSVALRDAIFSLGYIVGFCAVGNLLCYNFDERNDSKFFGRYVAVGKSYVMVLTADPSEREHTFKFQGNVVGAYNQSQIIATQGKAFLYVGKEHLPPVFHSGDTIAVTCDFDVIKNRKNPAEFDYAGFCNANNIFYSAFCGGRDLHLIGKKNNDIRSLTKKIHSWCFDRLGSFITDSGAKGLLQAMILGDEVNLDPELKDEYNRAGIVHIIAISGGNILLFFTAITYLLFFIRHKKHRWIKYIIALPLVWGYITIAGFPPSGVRAAIMFTVLAIGEMYERPKNQFNQLMAAAFCLLVAQPMWLFSMGFQLSFIAVLSLLIFYPKIYGWLHFKKKVPRFFWSVVAGSLAAEILAAPIVAFYFHQFPLLFVVANIVAVVLMEAALFIGLAIIVLSGFMYIPEVLGYILGWIVRFLNKAVEQIGYLQPVSMSRLYVSGLELLLIYIAIAALGYIWIRKLKGSVLLGLSAIVLAMFSWCIRSYNNANQEVMVVYNTSKEMYYEVAYGHDFFASDIDSTQEKSIKRITKSVHIKREITTPMNQKPGKAFLVNFQRVLVLDKNVDTTTKLPVGFVVYNGSQFPDIVNIQKAFTPQLIIVGAPFSIKQQRELQKIARDNHIYLFCTGIDGAFVLE